MTVRRDRFRKLSKWVSLFCIGETVLCLKSVVHPSAISHQRFKRDKPPFGEVPAVVVVRRRRALQVIADATLVPVGMAGS